MKTIAFDPWTMDDTSAYPDNRLFAFTQQGVRYKFSKNSVLKQFGMNADQPFINPLTLDRVSNHTLNRIRSMYIENNQIVPKGGLTVPERELLDGVDLLYKRATTVNSTYMQLANDYIEDMAMLLDNDELIRMKNAKNGLIRKGLL